MTPQEKLRRALLNDEFEEDTNDVERLLVPTGDSALRENRNVAMSAWMSQVTGEDINAGGIDWQASKDALAQGFFKLSDRNVSDEQMHTLIRSHIQTAEDAATMAAEGGLTGVPLPEIVSGLRAKRGASQLRPIFNRYEQDAIRRHTALTVKLAPYRGLVNQVAGELGQEMESSLPTTQKFQDVAERLLQVPEEDRPLVLQAIGATGGKDAKERASYLAKLAGAMGRMTETMGASVVSATSQAGLAEAEASLIEAGQMEFAGKMETERKRQRDFDLLTQQIRSVADQEIDPIKGDKWWSQLGIDLARMVPQSAVTVANPALGMAANYAYFENTLAGEAMMRNPGMTPDQARAVAGVAAPLNAAVETVTALIPFGKVKLPFVQKWLQATATSIPTAAARAGVRTATGTAAEIGEEYLQSYIPLQAQELLKALNADMPGVDWETHMPKFSEIAAQTWGPALVYSLVGAGSVSISEVNGGRALARDTDLMVAQGLAPATAEKIAKASESNDWQQVDALFRSDFTNPQKASDTEKAEATARYLDKIKAQQSTESMNAKEAANLGVRVFRDAESWKVEMGDGSVVKADSAEAARRMRDDIRMASTEYEAETMTALVDDIVNLRPQTRVEIRPEIAMATDEGIQFVDPITNKVTKINNAQSFQNLRNQAAAIDGDNRQDLAQSARLILGDNYVEFGESVARVFRSSRGKSDSVPAAITAGHEVIESSFRRGLASGLWTEQDARNAISSLLPALEAGIQRLGKKASEWEKDWLENAKKAVATGDSILIRETISEMGVRAWIGRDRDGNKTGLRPGTILRALDAAILQERKPENVTTYQRIRAWFKAVGAYLKGVVATAKIIRDAERNGTIEDFTAFLDKVLGLEAAMREESEVTQGVKEMAFSLDRAGAGGALHTLSDKFYKGGQFMPPPDSLGSRKAKKELQKFEAFKSPDLTAPLRVGDKWMVRVIPLYSGEWAKRHVVVAKFDNEKDALDALQEAQFQLAQRLGTFSLSPVTLAQDAEYLAAVEARNESEARRLYDEAALTVAVDYPESGYSKLPDNLLGFGNRIKGYEDENYKTEITVAIGEGYNAFVDGIKGLNISHAMARARRNWQGEKIRFVKASAYDPMPKGKVVPLSVQFSLASSFALSPTAGIDVVSDTLESWQGVFDAAARRNPTRAMAIREKGLRDLAKLADSYTQDRWTAKGDKIRALVEKRTKKSLDDEQAMREALRYQELLDDGMMKLTPDVLMAWSEGVGTLQDDPLIFKMLNDYGRLMSKATAEQRGLPINDLYDDAVWLPPQFYAKNAGIMPDVMANNLGFDTASEMWAALESSIKSHRSAKEGYAKAEAAVKAVDKQAREQAKAEAATWRQEADDMQAEDWSPRESLVRDMRTLNIILSAFPPEVRAKVTGGSMVKLAGLATERARYKAINTALQKAMEETEKFMRKEYTALVDDMLDVYRSQKDDSGRISGKLPSQYTELIDYAYRIREMDVEAQATESDGLEKALEKSESDEETQRILTKLGIVRLFEVWDTKDSVAMGAASDWLSGIIESGKLGRKLLDEDRKAMLDEFRGIAKKDALPEGEISRVDVANEANNVRFKVFRRAWQELNGALDSALHTMAQRLELVFGENSKVADYFTTRLIQAANASTDIKREINRSYHDILSAVFNTRSRLGHARAIGAMQKVKASGIMLTEGRVVEEVKLDIETLTKLSDGTMTAEAAGLRQDQVEDALNQWAASNRKRTVTVEVVKNAGTQKERQMTELQGIQWWLWSRQDDSRKQMERDGWTEESFKQLEEFLSPEAKALGQWIASSYDQAARMIDPVYRRLFNAPLPRVKNYAPIYRVRSGDAAVMDLDASDISSGLSAGFTKSRVNTVSPLAEMDAITVMLTHWENVAHWVTHAEVVRDAKAILLDRDVQTAIKQKSGKVSADSIKARVAAIESQGTNAARELVDLSRWWRRIMQYQAFKGLAFRLSPVVKQTSALLNPLLADVPAHSYAVGLARAFTDPAAFGRDVAEMWKSDTIMRRIEGGFSAEARIAMQGEGAAGSVALAWMQRGMMPMAWTDAGWTALGAAISYDYYRRGYMAENPGAPAAMADAYATKQLEKMIATSAQPSDIVNRSLVEASSNPFMRSLWMFASDQRKALGIEVTALKKLLSGKSKNKALDIQRILVAHFAQAAVTQLMASILASFIGDEEDKEREWSREQWALSLAIGPINGLFVFGRFIDMAGRRLLGLRVFPGGTVVERVGNDVVKGATAVDELFNPEDPEEFIDAMNKVTAGASGVMSMAIGPQAGVADVTANLLREGQKVMDAASED